MPGLIYLIVLKFQPPEGKFMHLKYISLIIFVVTYTLFVFLPNKRTLVSVLAALVLLTSGAVPLLAAPALINWNVMGLFVGTLFIADLFMKSRVPACFAEIIINRSKNTAWAMLFICMMTGFISAFVENVATVLIIAPIALTLAKKINLNPVQMMIAIALSSNLQGTATLIGDPPSMLLGGFAHMNFGDFFFFHGKPSIFFAVEIGALVSFLVLFFVFRRQTKKVSLIPTEKITSWLPTFLLILLIFLLAGTSFMKIEFEYTSGLICIVLGMIAVFWNKIFNRTSIREGFMSVDWETALFLAAIFILVGSITYNGWIEIFSSKLSGMIGQNIFWGYTMIVFMSVFFSAFVDNVPFLAAMLPLAASLAEKLQVNPSLFLFGLLIGASLGGNITPIGASANIVACNLLKKEGHSVKFGEFMRIGLPFTLAAVIPAYLFIWFLWGK